MRQTFIDGADFSGAVLDGCSFEGNEYDLAPLWTSECPCPPSAQVVQAAMSEFDPPGYLAWRRNQDERSL